MKKNMLLIFGAMFLLMAMFVSAGFTTTQTNVSVANRILAEGMDISADGQDIFFMSRLDPGLVVYYSHDGGATYNNKTFPNIIGYWITMSDDGSKVAFVNKELPSTNLLTISTDGGSTWANKTIPFDGAYAFTMSDDGSKLIGYDLANVYVSSDNGDNWNSGVPVSVSYNYNIATDSDGSVVLVGNDGGYMLLSTDGGSTWQNVTSAGNNYFYGVGVSPDGTKMCGVVYDYGDNDPGIMVSLDSGSSWDYYAQGDDGNNYCDITNDGNIVMANWNSYIYHSEDSGATWGSTFLNGAYSVGMSGDWFVTMGDVSQTLVTIMTGQTTGGTPFTVGCQLAECKIPANTTLLNTDPTIVQWQQNAEYTLTAGANTNHTFWFVANDINGVANLNDATAYFTLTGEGISADSCTGVDINLTARNYTCTIELPYWTTRGYLNYDVGVTDSNSGGTSWQDTVTINSLDAIDYDIGIVFTTLSSGTNDNAGETTTFSNLGNGNYATVKFTAYDVVNGDYSIPAENYNLDYQPSNGGADGVEGTAVAIPGATLGYGQGANINIYPYVDVPSGLPAGNYTSSSNWVFQFE